MTQRQTEDVGTQRSCELLSNLYLCIGWHSLTLPKTNASGVVNCFQICIFVSDDTARRGLGTPNGRLWIAFKFVSLYRMTQPNVATKPRQSGCELLSNLYLCIGWHSCMSFQISLISVVNCFQICIFVSDDTAPCTKSKSKSLLWIAFKFVSLYRMTQPAALLGGAVYGCELLSNLYLCIGWHSQRAR